MIASSSRLCAPPGWDKVPDSLCLRHRVRTHVGGNRWRGREQNRLAAHQPQVLDASAYQPSSHAHPLVFRYDRQGARMCINGESISPLKVARVNKICPTALPSYRASSDNAGRALSSSSKEATKSASLLKPNARVSTSRISLASLLSVI